MADSLTAERERLDALRRYDILDTPDEEAFDRLARLAGTILEAPIALVNFVDRSRLWCKAAHGLDFEGSSRDVAFCDRTIQSSGLTVIPDTTEDERFADVPVVTGEPGIRFYAGAPLETEDGHRLGTLCVLDTEPRPGLTDDEADALRDLAATVVDELELRRARTAAEQANQLKAAFLANMSHDIRSPLTSIVGFADLLGQRDLGEKQRVPALIKRSAQQVIDTVDQILQLSKLEAGAQDFDLEAVDVRATVRSVIDVLRPQAGGIALQTDLPETPVQALADATALQRVLNNLIGNALKYTPDDGTVTIAVAPAEDQVTIHVEDTGPGMDPDAVPHLFEPFAQAPDSNGRARTGSGLGLAIAKRLADAMEADLRVDTAPGEGTRFTVTLPR